ncbi:MAG: type II 3-dehydroquinate dehydratase [Betaproteobacteria bacterium]|nr:type II 3-dehydroquinate dehydratase [Betaproteobacteria bacterium]MDH5221045.1 type II 3-dehydroquinate dehydratase [Betaproteobacteria bacterium]MDH5349420.1 type II 3-dehydroquinate dehydratase [Betaproteobacteria bacterium]
MAKSGKTASILLLNGPNLNLLGTREPHLYGSETLAQIERRLTARAKAAGVKLTCVQTNHEGVAVDCVQQAKRDGVGFILLNPAAFTYSSIALRDALTAVQIPFLEVHLSNIHAREPWRAHSHFTAVAVGSILGLGSRGYDLAFEFALERVKAGGGA